MSDDDRLGRALSLMKDALHFLDEGDAAADVGAHLDLAIHRLQQALDSQNRISCEERDPLTLTEDGRSSGLKPCAIS